MTRSRIEPTPYPKSSMTTQTDKSLTAGYFYVALAAILWAASGSSAKFLFTGGMTPFQLVQLRTTLSWAALLIWLLLRRAPFPRISSRDLVYFILLGVLGIAGAQFFYFYAISKIKVAAAILLHYLGPVFIALYAAIFAHERPDRITTAAIVCALAGCGLVVDVYNLDLVSLNRTGILAGLCAALAFATYSVMGEYGMRRYDPWTVLFYAFMFAALIWNILHPPLEALFHPYSAIQWAWIVYISVFGTVLPFGLYFEGINRIRSSHASITATLEPIAAAGMSWLFLGEALSPLQVAGGVLVIASVVILQIRRQDADRAPATIRAKGAAE
jgi:drug/metabolite transporter (DMT)-like permease